MDLPTVFSVGHSTHSIDKFLQLLKNAGITGVADVRSSPWSKHCPHFSRPALKASLRDDGIDYRFFGRQLGGRPADASLYEHGVADYEAMARTSLFEEGIARVLAGSKKHRLALMCSEHDPLDCHRCLLVGRALWERGTSVSHLLSDESVQTQEDIEERLLKLSGQMNGDFFAPHSERLSSAYRDRSRRVAYAERPAIYPSEWEALDVQYN
jgi:uncharacterized protein (DUF488 family)